MCRKCWNKGINKKFNQPEIIIKSFFTPMDLYLDMYTPFEMRNLDN